MWTEAFGLRGLCIIELHDGNGVVHKRIVENTIVQEGLMSFIESLSTSVTFKASRFYLYTTPSPPSYATEAEQWTAEHAFLLETFNSQSAAFRVANKEITRYTKPYAINRAADPGVEDGLEGVGFEVMTTFKNSESVPAFNQVALAVRDTRCLQSEEVAILRETVLGNANNTDPYTVKVFNRGNLNLLVNEHIVIDNEVMRVSELPSRFGDQIIVKRGIDDTPITGHNATSVVRKFHYPGEEKMLSFVQLGTSLTKGDLFLTLKWIYEIGKIKCK